jgi:hypothetical protein
MLRTRAPRGLKLRMLAVHAGDAHASPLGHGYFSGKGISDIAGQKALPARRLHHAVEERCRRGFPIGPGDRVKGQCLHVPVGKLEFPDDLRPGTPGPLQRGNAEGHAGAHHHEGRIPEHILLVASQGEFHPGGQFGHLCTEFFFGLQIRHRHLIAFCLEEPRSPDSASCQSHHHRPPHPSTSP